jgi:large subunit ribosomal protein L23
MRAYSEVIIRPLLTEKNARLRETSGKVAFEVIRDASKVEIKRAVEEAFKVKVTGVNVLNVGGKPKRMGRFTGKRRDWKKAVITLAEGSSIEFFKGV